MKKIFIFPALLFSFCGFSQDDSTEIPESKKCNLRHEIGVNATLLLKQVFNLSNNTFTTLPYNLTYKLIWKDFVFRTGAGFSRTESKVEETETSVTTGTSSPNVAGPDKMVPTVNSSYLIAYRAGFEYRHIFDKRIAAYAGLDFVTDYGKSHAQSSSEFNNLPSSYQYTKTTNDVTLKSYGGGPVFGIQLFLSKHLGLFTEVPIYFVQVKQKDISESYQNVGQMNFSGQMNYTATTTKNTEETTASGLTIILPVTLYLSFMF